jgi:hypothetical protein
MHTTDMFENITCVLMCHCQKYYSQLTYVAYIALLHVGAGLLLADSSSSSSSSQGMVQRQM